MINNTIIYAVLLCAAASLAFIQWQRAGSLPLYPGPRRYPLVGSALAIPRDMPVWKGFMSMAKEFNTNVLYLRIFSTDFVVLNTTEDVCNLLEKRSGIYSNRPKASMLELMGVYSAGFFALMNSGSQWRRGRRLFHEFFNVKVVTAFDDHQRKYSHRFLSLLAQSPDKFLNHVRFVTGALVMEITYGLDIKSHDDKFLKAAEHAAEYIIKAMVPGAFLVDTFPILKYVPEWFPGAGFKSFAKEGGKLFAMAFDGPFEWAKESLKSNESKVSIASSGFDRVVELQDQGFDGEDVRAVTATIFIAAADTTMSILKGFFLVMALNPHVVKKAQEELDRVVGNERLPDLSDWESLPYISALMKELLRWTCPTPLSLPKLATKDDIYNGCLIPAGAIIFENVWAVCNDETVYPEPQTYDPERFLKDGRLDSSVKDPEEMMFGSGRRICPGKHFALRTLFLHVACTLAVFDISPPVGEKLEVKYLEALVRHPLPFKCVISPRSATSLKLVENVCGG